MVVIDTDGSAFITKAEFDSLKNNFQAQIDNYNSSIDSKIDGAIASYLAGIRIANEIPQGNYLNTIKSFGITRNYIFRPKLTPYAGYVKPDGFNVTVLVQDNGGQGEGIPYATFGTVHTASWSWSGRQSELYNASGAAGTNPRFTWCKKLTYNGTDYWCATEDNPYVHQVSYWVEIWGASFSWSSYNQTTYWPINWDVAFTNTSPGYKGGGVLSPRGTDIGQRSVSACIYGYWTGSNQSLDYALVSLSGAGVDTTQNVIFADKEKQNDYDSGSSDVLTWYTETAGVMNAGSSGFPHSSSTSRHKANDGKIKVTTTHHKLFECKIEDLLNYSVSSTLGKPVYLYQGLPLFTASDDGNVKLSLDIICSSSWQFAIRDDVFPNSSIPTSGNVTFTNGVSTSQTGNKTLTLNFDVQKGKTYWLKTNTTNSSGANPSISGDIIITKN